MCGIVGIVGGADTAALHRMGAALAHRGPDANGAYLDPVRGIGLGMRRLAIIDVEGASPPLGNEDGTVWIVFNGEIYNHADLRARTERQGHRFRTASDTEAILHLYEEMGDDCVHGLRGMFAFAIYDARGRGRVLLARDRLGVKPLYVFPRGGQVLFASEIKALLSHPDVPRDVNLAAVDEYLALGYITGPETAFRGIFQIPPATRAVIEPGRSVRLERYWDVPPPSPAAIPDATALEEVGALCDEAVRLRTQADVPVGLLLSGGVDSATVAALMARHASQPIRTFTIGFDVRPDRTDESSAARRVAQACGAEHHETVMGVEHARDLLPRLMWHLDEPLADPAALPTFLLCAFAGRQVKVLLSGEGGDEVFGGYPRYRWFQVARGLSTRLPLVLRRLLSHPAWSSLFSETRARQVRLLLEPMEDADRHLQWVADFDASERALLYTHETLGLIRREVPLDAARVLVEAHLRSRGTAASLHSLQYLDMKTWLAGDLLTKLDRMSMASSVEAREPLLDHLLVERLAALPASLKIRRGETKWLLRRIADDLLGTAAAARPKHPFAVPTAAWLRGGLAPYARDLLLGRDAATRRWFREPAVRGLLEEHRAGTRDRGARIWSLMCLEMWLRVCVNRSLEVA